MNISGVKKGLIYLLNLFVAGGSATNIIASPSIACGGLQTENVFTSWLIVKIQVPLTILAPSLRNGISTFAILLSSAFPAVKFCQMRNKKGSKSKSSGDCNPNSNLNDITDSLFKRTLLRPKEVSNLLQTSHPGNPRPYCGKRISAIARLNSVPSSNICSGAKYCASRAYDLRKRSSNISVLVPATKKLTEASTDVIGWLLGFICAIALSSDSTFVFNTKLLDSTKAVRSSVSATSLSLADASINSYVKPATKGNK